MNIVIYATKDGLRTLYTTNEELAYLIAEERRSGANNDNSLGQSVYTIAFTTNDSVYTKYMIVKDSQRSNALGFIAFSLLINNNKTLNGEEIINLLDELSKTYTDNYIKNNYLNLGEKTLIKEEWNFVGDILNKYKEQDKTQKNEELHSGTKDAAIVYYKDEVDLREYFNKPFQEEYSDFKQVFFVNEDFKENPKNPLTVLSNSDIELKDIDLKNEYYYIKNYDPSKEISIIANEKERSDRKNNNCIRSKWKVEIRYSKDDRCFWPIQVKGTLSNIDSEIYNYLELNNNQISIKYDAFNNPEPKIKTITIEIKDRKGNFIDDADIKIGSKDWEKISGHQYECVFSGEDLIKRWDISVKKDSYFGSYNDVVPEKVTDKIVINLQKRIIVPIIIRDENSYSRLEDFEVWTKLTNGYKKTSQLEFIDDEILDSYTITIRKNGYQDGIIDFHPYKETQIKTTLKTEIKKNEKEFTNYKVDAGKYGKLKNNQLYSSNREDGSDVKDEIIPEKEYNFTHFILENETLIAQYNKKPIFRSTKGVVLLIVGVLALGVGIWLLVPYLQPNETKTTIYSSEIQNYVQGDSLNLNTLKNYKQEFEMQEPEILKKSQSIADWFWGREKQNDFTEYNGWKDNMKSIEDAINKRKLINGKKIKELKTLEYSFDQNKFETVIKKIDSTKYKEISNKLGNVNNKTLTEIAVAIDVILKPKESSNDGESQVKQQEKKSEQIKETQIINREKQPQTPQKQTTKISSIKNEEIIQYIKGGELKKNKLEDYKKNSTDSKLRRSIDIVLKIWELGKNNTTYHSAQQSCNNDQNLKDSELNKILKNINEKEKKENVDYAGLSTSPDILKKLKSK